MIIFKEHIKILNLSYFYVFFRIAFCLRIKYSQISMDIRYQQSVEVKQQIISFSFSNYLSAHNCLLLTELFTLIRFESGFSAPHRALKVGSPLSLNKLEGVRRSSLTTHSKTWRTTQKHFLLRHHVILSAHPHKLFLLQQNFCQH